MDNPETKKTDVAEQIDSAIKLLKDVGYTVTMRTEPMPFTGDRDFDEILNSCREILGVKGEDYTMGNQDRDRLHNFRTAAQFMGIEKKTVWATYFYKHVSAVFAFVKNNGKFESEPIEGRIADCINYLLLFYKIIKEEKIPVLSAEKK